MLLKNKWSSTSPRAVTAFRNNVMVSKLRQRAHRGVESLRLGDDRDIRYFAPLDDVGELAAASKRDASNVASPGYCRVRFAKAIDTLVAKVWIMCRIPQVDGERGNSSALLEAAA